jgi:glycosyltransferase involved in cell wall biosynthesis
VIPYASGITSVELAADAPYIESDYLLFVGTMEPRKNLPRLLAAYRAYVGRCGIAKKLKIVGGQGWGKIDPVQLVANHGLEGMIEVKGKVSDTTLSALYAGAYALIMPSIYEGFGLPVVEALAHGVPVIVSRASALSEVAAAAGYTVDPMSEESICEALCTMTTERDTYNRLRSSAPLRALDYSWDRSAAVMYKLLSDWR